MTDRLRLNVPADTLLIEGNAGDVRLTQEAFDESHLANTLHVVSDEAEALEFLNRCGEYADAPRPDLIALDLDLPRKSGAEFLERLDEASSRLARVPVTVLTSSQAEEEIVKSHELPANAYMTKPVDPTEFVATIRTVGTPQAAAARLPPAGNG